jgi:glutathione S-transferase
VAWREDLGTRVAHLKSQLPVKHDAYDGILDKQKYLDGNVSAQMKGANANIGNHSGLFYQPFRKLVLGIGIDEFSGRPNVSRWVITHCLIVLHRWWKDITSRPSWQAVKGGL